MSISRVIDALVARWRWVWLDNVVLTCPDIAPRGRGVSNLPALALRPFGELRRSPEWSTQVSAFMAFPREVATVNWRSRKWLVPLTG